MKNDNHFGQLKIFSKKVYIFEFEVYIGEIIEY
jgi:hypothetical protein